mgnify:CR=1 FL=1
MNDSIVEQRLSRGGEEPRAQADAICAEVREDIPESERVSRYVPQPPEGTTLPPGATPPPGVSTREYMERMQEERAMGGGPGGMMGGPGGPGGMMGGPGGPGGPGGRREVPQGPPWAFGGPPGAFRRPPGPSTNQSKYPQRPASPNSKGKWHFG